MDTHACAYISKSDIFTVYVMFSVYFKSIGNISIREWVLIKGLSISKDMKILKRQDTKTLVFLKYLREGIR